MDEIELKAYLTERVLSFCTRWNSIENTLYTERTAEEDKLRQELPVAEWAISAVIWRFLHRKKRVYGGKVRNSFGFPSKFNGCDHPLEVQVTLKNKSRAEIYIKTSTNFEDEYLFIALKKADEWRIDSYKNRRYGNEKWSIQIL